MQWPARGSQQNEAVGQQANSAIHLQAAAVTKRACEPGLMRQERRFLEAIDVVEHADLDRYGRLVLSGNGQRLVAQRQ